MPPILAAGTKKGSKKFRMRIHYPIFNHVIRKCRDLAAIAVAMISEPQ